jgi:hypothetical protein
MFPAWQIPPEGQGANAYAPLLSLAWIRIAPKDRVATSQAGHQLENLMRKLVIELIFNGNFRLIQYHCRRKTGARQMFTLRSRHTAAHLASQSGGPVAEVVGGLGADSLFAGIGLHDYPIGIAIP